MDYHVEHKWKAPWYDKLVVLLVFLVPLLLFISLGLESAILTDEKMKDFSRHDFRAVAYWFDPVFFNTICSWRR